MREERVVDEYENAQTQGAQSGEKISKKLSWKQSIFDEPIHEMMCRNSPALCACVAGETCLVYLTI